MGFGKSLPLEPIKPLPSPQTKPELDRPNPIARHGLRRKTVLTSGDSLLEKPIGT